MKLAKRLSRASQINGEPCFEGVSVEETSPLTVPPRGSVVCCGFSVLTVRRLFQPWYLIGIFFNYELRITNYELS